jgi:hypothetical protein
MAGNRLKVLSLKDPMKPEELGGVDLGAMATDMKAGDGVVCALCPQAAVFIDCADPTSPRVVSRVGLNAPHDVEISSGHAYISDTADGTVAILDIRDAPRPKLLSKIRGLNWNGLRLAVAQSGDRRMLFVAEYGAGDVRIYDVTDPGAPKEVGRWVNVSPWGGLPGRGGNLADVASDGKIAVVTNLCFGLHVLDVSDPARPTLLGEVRCAGEAGNLAVIDEETVAVEDYCQALLLFDTKDPANMHVVGQYPMGGRVWPGLVYRRPHCLISNQFPGGIIQVDVSDRQRPRPTSALVYESIGTGCMVARGHHAYVAHRYGYNVTVLDVSDPKRLRKVGATRPGSVSSFPSFDTTEDLLLAAQFCADSGPGPLGIFDITDPGHLRKIAALPLPGGCSSVSVQGSIAFCAGGGRLRAVDIRNPFRPRVIGDVPCDLGAIRVRGEYAYAIKGKGIAVFRVPLWAPDSDRWASWNALDNVGDTGDLHTAWLCSLDIRGPRAYAVAYNQLFAVEVPWSQLPPEPVTLIIGDVK